MKATHERPSRWWARARDRWRGWTPRRRAVASGVALTAMAGVVLGVALPLLLRDGGVECDRVLCVEVLGPMGDAVHPMTPVRIRLAGEGLDRKAAVAALQISNRPEGQVRFEKDVLTFRPEWPGFERGVRYEVALSLPASELPGGAEPLDLRFNFTVDGKLQVASVFPENGAREVGLDTPLMIQFNRSVAPLNVLGEADPTEVVSFDPPVEGEGRWLNTSLYTFTPGADGWAPATTYTARVKAGLTNKLGGRLDEDHVFTFTTLTPNVVIFFPLDNSLFVAPEPEIKVGFNQPVDRASAEASFTLVPEGGAPVEGTFEWTDDRTFLFHPESALALSTTYEAVVRAGVRAAAAEAAMQYDVRWRFTTVGVPRIASTTPAQGATNADRYGVSITFTNPMDQESVEDAVTVEPAPEGDPFFGWDPSGLTLYVNFPMRPSTAYRVAVSAAAWDRYGHPLPEPLDLRFTTRPLEPAITVYRPSQSGTFNAYLDPAVMVASWNVERVDFELSRIDREDLIRSERYDLPGPYRPPAGSLIRSWSESIPNPPLDEPVVTRARLAAPGETLPQGMYFLRATAPGVPGDQSFAFVVSSANVIVKLAQNEALVWAVDLRTGAPLVGLPLDVLDRDGRVIATGTTRDDGIARIPLDSVALSNHAFGNGYYISAETPAVTLLAGSLWTDGIAPWNFPDVSFAPTLPDLVGYVYTDRTIYRPGETVYVKGVVRRDDDARYSIPPRDTNLHLVLRDPFARVLYESEVELSDIGTFDAEVELNPEAATGWYSVELQRPEGPQLYTFVAYVSFRVAEFQKPEFEVTVTPEAESYVNGETIRATVSADLFFGSPLAGAEVRWQVTSQPFYFSDEDYPGYNFADDEPWGDDAGGPFYEAQQLVRSQGAGRTDTRGRFTFALPADVSADPVSQLFNLEATVTDQNGRSVGAVAPVTVHKGRFYVGLKPETYVESAGEPAALALVTLDPDGEPVGNIGVTVRVYERKWRTVRERDELGQQRYRSEPEDTLVGTVDARTGPNGEGTFSFTPAKSGQYYILAEARDADGNIIEASTFLWVSGSEYASWHVGNDDVIELVADKDEYAPGDVARVLVAAPFEASQGLVTLERGRILSHELRAFPTTSDVLEVRITDEHIPTVYVSVTLFRPPTADNPMPQAKFGIVKLRVSTQHKELRISIEPDRDRLEPRETVTYRIRTTDNEGNGVPAELSLALVDKAVLSLQEDSARPPVQAFWDERPLSVVTSSTFAVSIDRLNELAITRLQPGGKGGGGGIGEGTRTFFPNTAFWEPALRTDERGEARVEIALPDTLTTWRLTARGVTADTRAGEGRNEVVTSKDLIVRPVVPRFLIADDVAFLGAIVHNFTDRELSVDVRLAADGLDVRGGSTRSVGIAPGQDAMVRWETYVPPGQDEATLTFEAEGAGTRDAVGLTIPLYGFVTPEVVATAGEVTDTAGEAIEVPYYVRPDAGELTVRVAPSLAAGVRTGLAYLEEHPYESAETTVSGFLPALALRRAVDELGLRDVEAPDDVDALVRRSIQRLYNSQRDDGGWGWWVGDESDPGVSAYVLIGLAEAQQAGFEIDPYVLESAQQYLVGQLDLPRDVERPEIDLRAYMLYALARAGRGNLGRTMALVERPERLSNTAKALLLLTVPLAGGDRGDARLMPLLSALQESAIPSATGNHWEESAYVPDIFGNSTLTTAYVLQALTALQPEHPLIPGTLRWLMVARKDGRWESPHDTAVALLAITSVMIARGEAQGSFEYAVALNGEKRLEGRAEAGRAQQEDELVVPMKDLLEDAVNELAIARSPGDAPGRLYYTARLRYFTPAENVEAASQGIGVSHEYFAEEGDKPITEARSGDIVKVQVTLVAESDLNFLVLEDYLPAGLEPIDTSLRTSPPEVRRLMEDEQRRAYQVRRTYSPFEHVDIRDNRVALFARFVPRGVYEYTYFAQAATPGEFRVPPATAYEQYLPEVWGRSDGGVFIVRKTGAEAASGAPALAEAVPMPAAPDAALPGEGQARPRPRRHPVGTGARS
jgi:uncharacterized protein YfaS (alpha-2-macroglobulin family)